MLTATVNVAPAQFLAGWRPDAGRIFVPALSEARLGELVAVRVGLAGRQFRATVFGTVALVRRMGRPSLPPGAEIQLDEESRRAVAWLAAAARGAEVSFHDRAPRFVAEKGILAYRGRIALPVTTANVSASGGALRWAGALPEPGDELALRLGDGLLAAAPDAIVAWTELAASGPSRVGVRIVTAGRAARAWAKLAAEAALAGAFRV